MKRLIVIATVIMGCVEDDGLWIDTNCTPIEHRVIERSVETLNDVVGEEIVGILGDIRVENYDQQFHEYDTTDIVMCLHMENPTEQWPWLEGTVGYTFFDIILRTDLVRDNNNLQVTMMHELMHYIGIGSELHSDNPDDIFYWGWNPGLEPVYTAHDIELIRSAI